MVQKLNGWHQGKNVQLFNTVCGPNTCCHIPNFKSHKNVQNVLSNTFVLTAAEESFALLSRGTLLNDGVTWTEWRAPKKFRILNKIFNLYQSQEIPKQNKTYEKLFVGSSVNWLFKWIVVSGTKIFIAVLTFFQWRISSQYLKLFDIPLVF